MEAQLAEPLQAIASLLSTYPTASRDAVQAHVTALIASVSGKSRPFGVVVLCSVGTGRGRSQKRLLRDNCSLPWGTWVQGSRD